MKVTKFQLYTSAAAVFAALLLGACKDKNGLPVKAEASPANSATMDPRSQVIGVESSGKTIETAATTSPANSEISKAQQSNAMPLPGQANDDSTLSPLDTKKPKGTAR